MEIAKRLEHDTSNFVSEIVYFAEDKISLGDFQK